MFGDQIGLFDAPAPTSSVPVAKPATAVVPRDPGPLTLSKIAGKSSRKVGFAVAAHRTARQLSEAYTARYAALDGRPW